MKGYEKSPVSLETSRGSMELVSMQDKGKQNILYTDSFAAEKLNKLIEKKRRDFDRPKPDWAQKELQDEILFLREEILPIVLNETTLLFSEISRHLTNKIREAVKYEANTLVLVLPLMDSADETIRIATVNPNRDNPFEGIEIGIEAHGRKIEEIIL